VNQIKSKKKVAIIGTVGIPANYGGFETLTEQLVRILNKDVDFTVYCSSKAYKKQQKQYLNARLKYIPLSANGVSSIFYDMISILNSLLFADVILILGVSGAFMIPIVKLFTSKKIIINVDGQEWKRAKWNVFAKQYLKLQERIAVKYSDIIIADNKAIQENLEQDYKTKSELIAYGGNHANKEEISDTELKSFDIDKPYYFSVCRIEPENNIHIILEAFSKINERIVFVGNWDASDYGSSLRNEFSKYSNIKMLDPIYNQIKLDKLRSNCKVYVHGHSAGGTNPSLVEAMYLQLPILAWNVNYNRYTTQGEALYFNDVESLERLLNVRNDEDKLNRIALNLYQTATINYNWKGITDAYKVLF